MSTGWSAFRRDMERQAVPRVEAELVRLGWRLTGTHPWSAIATHGRPLPRSQEVVSSCSADGLVQRVQKVEADAGKTCCEGECEECFGAEGETP